MKYVLKESKTHPAALPKDQANMQRFEQMIIHLVKIFDQTDVRRRDVPFTAEHFDRPEDTDVFILSALQLVSEREESGLAVCLWSFAHRRLPSQAIDVRRCILFRRRFRTRRWWRIETSCVPSRRAGPGVSIVPSALVSLLLSHPLLGIVPLALSIDRKGEPTWPTSCPSMAKSLSGCG